MWSISSLRAQVLDHMDLLTFEPIAVALRQASEGGDEGSAVRVLLPQPALYVVQKVLARETGRLSNSSKAAKDLAYMFDVALLSKRRWSEQCAVLTRAAESRTEWSKRITRSIEKLRTLFVDAVAEGPLAVSSQYRSSRTAGASEHAIAELMQEFASAINPA